jgi:thiamine biosynthesis lipoprotein
VSRAGRLLLALAAIALIALPARAASKRHPAAAAPGPRAERGRVLMGTLCTGVAEATDTTRAAAALDSAFDEIARLEQVMSNWRENSELSRLNATAFENRVPCSPDLYAVLDAALGAARDTDGSFDPTVEPLTQVWKLRGEGQVPAPDSLREARDKVGWRRVQLEPGTRSARFSAPGVALDLGGIGKGYALDRAADLLRGRGVKRALLNLGGEVLAMTTHDPWLAAIADPADRTRPLFQLSLSNGALSTSAQSEHGFEVRGVWYGHILDPRTGSPVSSRASVSVVTRSATRADALSTALLVMGRERARRFAAAHRELRALWLEPEGAGVVAEAWNLDVVATAPFVTLLPSPSTTLARNRTNP